MRLLRSKKLVYSSKDEGISLRLSNDQAKGGDINLALVIDQESSLEIKRAIQRAIKAKIGEQKIDIIIDRASYEDPFLN